MKTVIHETDAIIIGAGPVGLFAVFELGLYDMKAHLIDILDKPGGQCAELYPEKPIYDIPAFPVITGQELTDRLMAQIAPFKPVFHWQQMAAHLTELQDDDGRRIWQVTTDEGLVIQAPVVVVAAGGGSFVPKKPALPDLSLYEQTNSVRYIVRQLEDFKDKRLVIAGGGDSALDWVLALQPLAAHITLLHHRAEFRAAPDSVSKMRSLAGAKQMDCLTGRLQALQGQNGQLEAVIYQDMEKQQHAIPADNLLVFYGLTMNLGRLAELGIQIAHNLIPVDTEKFETNLPGVFAIGDINSYPGKQKLILSGFHEAALMAKGAFGYVYPDKRFRFQYTTSSSQLQTRLGVK